MSLLVSPDTAIIAKAEAGANLTTSEKREYVRGQMLDHGIVWMHDYLGVPRDAEPLQQMSESEIERMYALALAYRAP